MSGFISALIKQRKDAKKAEPNTNARLKEILDILKKSLKVNFQTFIGRSDDHASMVA